MKFDLIYRQKKKNAELFKLNTGYEMDYHNPKTFNEKLNWIKFNYRDPLMTKCSGKDSVREYVRTVLGEGADRYLIPLSGGGVYDTLSDTDYDSLPEKFVLKLNNGSGKNIVCGSKSHANKQDILKEVSDWLKPGSNHYFSFFEWGYKNVKPKIVCEEYLGDIGTIRDYKFFCFNGVPRFIYVSQEYDSAKSKIDMEYVDLNWNRLNYKRKSYNPPVKSFEEPNSLQDMIKVAEALSRPFPFVRVDFFEVDDEPKVVELTFYPGAGYGAFESIDTDLHIGSMLRLPKPMRKARFIDISC